TPATFALMVGELVMALHHWLPILIKQFLPGFIRFMSPVDTLVDFHQSLFFFRADTCVSIVRWITEDNKDWLLLLRFRQWGSVHGGFQGARAETAVWECVGRWRTQRRWSHQIGM